MRIIAASVVVLLVGLVAVGPAQADHPLSFLRKHHGGDCGDASCHKHPFGALRGKLACHPLFSKWSGGHGHGHGAGGHPFHHVLGCQYHAWFNTYKALPDNPFPQHPFARSPRDFFMYENGMAGTGAW